MAGTKIRGELAYMPLYTNAGVIYGIHLGAGEGRATSRMLGQKGDASVGLLNLAPKPQHFCLYSSRVLLQARQLQIACTSQLNKACSKFQSIGTMMPLTPSVPSDTYLLRPATLQGTGPGSTSFML